MVKMAIKFLTCENIAISKNIIYNKNVKTLKFLKNYKIWGTV